MPRAVRQAEAPTQGGMVLVSDILARMASDKTSEITDLLVAWRSGDEVLSELMPRVYRRLREIAHHLLRGERQGHSLETTALVHEAYLRLIDLERIDWNDRAHFFAMCARLMRRVLVDHARHRGRTKRGGDAQQISTSELFDTPTPESPDLVAVDEALRELAVHDARKAQIVELRFFGGLDREEIATVIGISSATVTRQWLAARAWLIRYLSPEA